MEKLAYVRKFAYYANVAYRVQNFLFCLAYIKNAPKRTRRTFAKKVIIIFLSLL